MSSCRSFASAFAPSASLHYWFRGYFADAHRTGDLSYISNQSLNGLLVRLLGSAGHARPLWIVAATGAAIFVLWIARRAHAERPWLGEALAMSGMLLVSPVSWVHHWIIVLPLLLAAFRCASETSGRIRVSLLGVTAALSAVLLFRVVWRVPVTDERVYHQSRVPLRRGELAGVALGGTRWRAGRVRAPRCRDRTRCHRRLDAELAPAAVNRADARWLGWPDPSRR